MEQKGIEGIIFAIIGLFGLCLIIVFLFVVFQKKKNAILKKQLEDKQQFENEISELQIEIREQTLRNISWELHDNIGQLLTLAKIQVQGIKEISTEKNDLKTNLDTILSEVRALSKIINPDFINNINLVDALKLEIDRFNRLNYIKAKLIIEGEIFEIDPKSEIVIFRILQEFFSNTIKHSRANNLEVKLFFDNNIINIFAIDNGKGFDNNEKNKNGIGLSNIKKRGQFINAIVKIETAINVGTKLSITYKNKMNE